MNTPERAELPSRKPSHWIAEGNRKFLMVLASVGCAIAGALLGYLVIFVIHPMARPGPFLEEVLERGDQHQVDMLLMAEYTAAGIRTMGAQIAVAIVTGLLLTASGILLLGAGLRENVRLSGGAGVWQFDVSRITPGAMCLLLGAAIILVGITKDPMRPMDFSASRSDQPRVVPRNDIRLGVPPGGPAADVNASLDPEEEPNSAQRYMPEDSEADNDMAQNSEPQV